MNPVECSAGELFCPQPDTRFLVEYVRRDYAMLTRTARVNRHLKGERGQRGFDGVPGNKGERGYNGSIGSPGLPGKHGPPGGPGKQGHLGVPGLKGSKGDHGLVGKKGIQGVHGEKGEKGDHGVQGVPGRGGFPGVPGHVGPAGPAGQAGKPGTDGAPGPASGGAVYIRWGRTVCPETQRTELVYSGKARGTGDNQTRSSSNYLCLPDGPEYLQTTNRSQGISLQGVKYTASDNSLLSGVENGDAPCAMCYAST